MRRNKNEKEKNINSQTGLKTDRTEWMKNYQNLKKWIFFCEEQQNDDERTSAIDRCEQNEQATMKQNWSLFCPRNRIGDTENINNLSIDCARDGPLFILQQMLCCRCLPMCVCVRFFFSFSSYFIFYRAEQLHRTHSTHTLSLPLSQLNDTYVYNTSYELR